MAYLLNNSNSHLNFRLVDSSLSSKGDYKMAENLYLETQKAQSRDQEALLYLIEKFKPLIKHYAYKLHYDDSEADLLLNFIQMVIDLPEMKDHSDGAVVSYIVRSVYHDYLRFLKKHQKNREILLSALESDYHDNTPSYILDRLGSSIDEYPQIEFQFLFEVLTQREAEIIIYHYYKGYAIKEIASKFNVSSSTISQSKMNAIKKLRKIYKNRGLVSENNR